MNIRFAETETKHTEEEVIFPIYSRSEHEDGSGYNRYVKRTSPIHSIEIMIRKGHGFIGYEISTMEKIVEVIYINKDFYLGKGKYKCTKEQFEQALKDTKEWIDKTTT